MGKYRFDIRYRVDKFQKMVSLVVASGWALVIVVGIIVWLGIEILGRVEASSIGVEEIIFKSGWDRIIYNMTTKVGFKRIIGGCMVGVGILGTLSNIRHRGFGKYRKGNEYAGEVVVHKGEGVVVEF